MSHFRTEWFSHPRFSDAASGGRTIKLGEQGAAVQVLQQALIALGFSMPVSTQKKGSPDGIFGNETDARVRDFQKKAIPNQTPDGKVGPMTLTALDNSLVGKPVPVNNSSITWGRAPANVPGSPAEADLGTVMGWHSAVRQMHDMACWAACLSFWAKYCGGGRPRITQGRIHAMYGHLVENDGAKMGGISTSGYDQILSDRATPENIMDPSELNYRWKGFVRNPFDISSLTYDWLRNNTSDANRALLLGYTINGASHINVIGYYDFDGTPYVWAMEPWDGRFKLREIDYYRQSTKSFYAYPM